MASHATATREIDVRSPFDQRLLGTVPAHDAAYVETQVGIAQRALASPLPPAERAAILERAATLLVERHDEFARSISEEAGKPIASARVEAERAVDTMRYSAIEARTLVGDMIPMDATESGAGKLGFTMRRPRGVVAAISPFNFPLNLCVHKVGPAVAAGCPVVHKPASATPLTAVMLHELMLEAGLPDTHYRLVTGSGGEVGDALVSDPRVAHVTFTGSSEVGWAMRARSPRAHVSLELGNSTPIIVFDDADIADVAARMVKHAYGFAGQSCISAQRLIVQRPVYDAMVDAMVAATRDVVSGDPANDDTLCGPVIDDDARERILETFDAARSAGARVLTGATHDGNVIAPTVLADVDPAMDVSCRELFGPGIALMPFDAESDAIALANGTPYGLQAGVFTNDLDRALRVATALDFGGVMVNEAATFRADQQPYGGIKESGNTKEGPHWSVREMTQERLVVIARR